MTKQKRGNLSGRLRKASILAGAFGMAFLASQTAKAEETASFSAYEKQELKKLVAENALQVTNGKVTMQENEKANGLMVEGKAEELSKAKFTFQKDFDFSSLTAGNLIVDGVAQKKRDVKLKFYLDDSSKSFASVSLCKQKRDDVWKIARNYCADLSEMKITAKHKLSFQIDAAGDKDVKVLLRSVLFSASSVPVVSFDLDETQGSISEMRSDDKHEKECYGSVTVKVPKGYRSEYTTKECKTQTCDLDYIRGRGNSTWWPNKKPYKFKLDKKADFFGMGKNKHWVLLANYYDVSMLRNKYTYWLGKEMGMEFTPECVFVDLVMNGEYLGSYYLCEHVRVGDSRVDIDDLEENDTTKNAVDAETISGGYLLSMYPDESEGANKIIKTTRENSFLIESPDFEDYMNEAQYKYISEYMQKTEDAIYGEDFKDENGRSYTEYMDVDAAIDYYLIQEISKNGDAFWSGSTYLYKKRNGKLFWGPLWDFDYVAWAATDFSSDDDGSGFECNTRTWFAQLLRDDTFFQKIKARWNVLREKLLDSCKSGGQIDKYADQLAVSQKANYQIWDMYSEGYYDGKPEETSKITWEGEVSRLKTWITKRVAQVDKTFDEMQPKICTLTYMSDGKVYKKENILKDTYVETLPEAPKKNGYIFKGWYTKTKIDKKDYEYIFDSYQCRVMEDMTIYAKWEKVKKSPKAVKLAFEQKDYYVYRYSDIQPKLAVFPFAASRENIKWESSDKTIGTVSDTGYVSIEKNLGVTTITATTAEGLSASCKIHVVDYGQIMELRGFEISKTSLTLKKNTYSRLYALTIPEKYNAAEYGKMIWNTSDASVVEVDSCGNLFAKKAGTAVIVLSNQYRDGLYFCKVTVTDPDAAKKGSTITSGNLKYRILEKGKVNTVSCIGMKDKKETAITIPAAVKYGKTVYKVVSIGKSAFKNCTALKKVRIGTNVEAIGDKAFYGCKKLEVLTIDSKKVKSIGKQALKNTNKNVKVKGKKKYKQELKQK